MNQALHFIPLTLHPIPPLPTHSPHPPLLPFTPHPIDPSSHSLPPPPTLPPFPTHPSLRHAIHALISMPFFPLQLQSKLLAVGPLNDFIWRAIACQCTCLCTCTSLCTYTGLCTCTDTIAKDHRLHIQAANAEIY